MKVRTVLDDLIAEQDDLDTVVRDLDPARWSAATASPRWSVSDQIGHLTFFDRAAALAISDPAQFETHRTELLSCFDDEIAVDSATLGGFRLKRPGDQLDEWRRGRDALVEAAATLTDDTRVEWYGPSMSAPSFLTARLMEVWAHGQDVCDTVGVVRRPTDRLRHIAQLGVITRRWSYAVRGETAPDGEVRVELAAPSGTVWTWGPEDADDSISGPAEDFCLVVTQRRHADDTVLTIRGDRARGWMARAQAFAGRPTEGPAAGSGREDR